MVRRIYRNLCSYLLRIKKRERILATILIVFWSSFVFFNFILKGSYIFEGQITASEMSFIYNGNLDKPLLQNIKEIKKLDIKGKQLQPLTLKGNFTTKDQNLNQKLSSLDKINIEFPNSTSRLIITPNNNNFSISELRINSNTRINQLTYNPEKQLSFCLQSAIQNPEYCLFPQDADNDPKFPNSESLANLKLRLSQQSYLIDLEQVNIPEVNITSDLNAPQLNYIPQKTREPQINIPSPTKIVIDVPATENTQWFYEDLDVTDVQFYRVQQSYDVADEILASTIIKGKVRMKDEKLELKDKQFLIVADDKPGIRKLRYLAINPLEPQSLQTFISGESKGIAIGLYPEFPIKSIKPSWLAKYFSSSAIAGILSFISAFTAVVLEKILFPDNP